MTKFRTRSTTTRDRNLLFRGAISTGFFEFSPVDFSHFSPCWLCNLVRKSPQNMEKVARFPGPRKKRRILSRLWLSWFFRGRHGGVEKGGGWKASRKTPLPERGFGPPLVRYVFHPPQASALCFSYTKVHDRADQKLFWRGPKIFGRARSLVRFPPPIRFAPPHITAQVSFSCWAFAAGHRRTMNLQSS